MPSSNAWLNQTNRPAVLHSGAMPCLVNRTQVSRSDNAASSRAWRVARTTIAQVVKLGRTRRSSVGSKQSVRSFPLRLSARHRDTIYTDEVFVKVSGKRANLCTAADQQRSVLHVCFLNPSDARAASRPFRPLLRGPAKLHRRIVPDKPQKNGTPIGTRPLSQLTLRTGTPTEGRSNRTRRRGFLWGI